MDNINPDSSVYVKQSSHKSCDEINDRFMPIDPTGVVSNNVSNSTSFSRNRGDTDIVITQTLVDLIIFLCSVLRFHSFQMGSNRFEFKGESTIFRHMHPFKLSELLATYSYFILIVIDSKAILNSFLISSQP
jgi:hypothetical protein